ncbi:MAG: tyrosine-protein phosphatase [Saprospiraceae bacterium]
MHSHLIPQIDDGAKSLEESISLIRELKNMGFQKIITTPHIMSEHYPNTPEKIRLGFEKLKNELVRIGLEIEIEVAAEYFVDEKFFELLQANSELMTFGNNQILIEFSTFSKSNNIHELIFQLNTKGYLPILAHPERYLYYADDFNFFKKIKSMGCDFQVNILSLSNYYGSAQKKLGMKLLKEGLVDYLGTDIHRMNQVGNLNILNDKKINALLQKNKFKNNNL